MQHLKQLTLTLALLITAAAGAWAADVLYATADGNTMTLKYGPKPSGAYQFSAGSSNWFQQGSTEDITSVVIDPSCRDFNGTNLQMLFFNFGR